MVIEELKDSRIARFSPSRGRKKKDLFWWERVSTRQERGEVMNLAAWKRRPIPNVEKWVGRNSGHTDYFVAQFSTGHAYFKVLNEKEG